MVCILLLRFLLLIVLLPMWLQQIKTSMKGCWSHQGQSSQVQHFPACCCRRRHLVIDAHRVACVAGQLRRDIHDMIVASGGSHVLFANKHVTTLQIEREVLARAHRLSHSMRFKHQDRRAHGSSQKKSHLKVQIKASYRSLSRHVSHPRKRGPV